MAEHQIQRNRRTGEYRQLTEQGWEPYTPMPEGTPERYLPGLADTPTSATVNELLRQGKEYGTGVLQSPIDALKGLFQMVTEGKPPLGEQGVSLGDLPGTYKHLTESPRDVGSILGQLLLGKMGIPKVPGAVARIPEAVSATGRGMERAGTALAESRVGGITLPGLGAVGALSDPRALALAATPYALKYGGKGLQRVGGGLERLKEALAPTPQAAAPVARSTASAWPAAVEHPELFTPSQSTVADWLARETALVKPKPYEGPIGRPAGTRAPTVEQSVADVLEGLRTSPTQPIRVSGVPEPTITSAGREGAFYSTGRPSTGTSRPTSAAEPPTPTPKPLVRPSPSRDNYSDVLGARRTPVSENPMLEALAPLPEGDAWSVLRTLKTRNEPPMPGPAYRHPILREPPTNLNSVLSLADEGDVSLPIPAADPLSRLDALGARQLERYGRTQPYRSESAGVPELPAAWQPFTENPVTQDLIRVLEGLRRRQTPGLTNPTGR